MLLGNLWYEIFFFVLFHVFLSTIPLLTCPADIGLNGFSNGKLSRPLTNFRQIGTRELLPRKLILTSGAMGGFLRAAFRIETCHRAEEYR